MPRSAWQETGWKRRERLVLLLREKASLKARVASRRRLTHTHTSYTHRTTRQSTTLSRTLHYKLLQNRNLSLAQKFKCLREPGKDRIMRLQLVPRFGALAHSTGAQHWMYVYIHVHRVMISVCHDVIYVTMFLLFFFSFVLSFSLWKLQELSKGDMTIVFIFFMYCLSIPLMYIILDEYTILFVSLIDVNLLYTFLSMFYFFVIFSYLYFILTFFSILCNFIVYCFQSQI